MPKNNKKILLYGEKEEESPMEPVTESFSFPKVEYKIRLITSKSIILTDSDGNGRNICLIDKYRNLKQGDVLLLVPE
jgi:hypothetical protein